MIKEIINKKCLGEALTRQELEEIFLGYLEEKVPDYQMSSLLMAICLKGMTLQETIDLTDIFLHSGEVLDFSMIEGVKVDKHSTGGVGDKTTLVIVPIVSALGIPVVKMSGRGLGYTGGTIDKLEAIPGFRTDLSIDEIIEQVKQIGAVITGQTGKLCPLDQKIYALRDVSGTTDSIPLIASSIMSKKIAAGADKILIDIKVGKGALLSTEEEARKLAQIMVEIGNHYGKETKTIISSMDEPLGCCVGNALEVKEAIEVLQGKKRGELYELCVELASNMISLAKGISVAEAKVQVQEALESKKAYQQFLRIIDYQGGRIEELKVSSTTLEVKAEKQGVVQKIDALQAAKLACQLGAGRLTKNDKIAPEVGLRFVVSTGTFVAKGDVLLVVYQKENDQSTYDYANIFTIE